jgi:biopolymer transport protein ExbD
MTIRYFLLSLILFATSCSGQQNSNTQVQIDTAKLFDPKQEPVDYSSTDMFKNFVLLNQQPFELTIQGKQFQIKSDKELFNKIREDKAQVVKSKFYIVVDSSFAFRKIVDIVDNIKKSGVSNYKVINFDSYFKSSEPITIEQPTITTKTVNANDSSYFSLTILNDSFEANFLNKKKVFKSSSEVDRFIQDNKTLINPNKILIIGNAKVSYEKMKPILEILKKYEYYKFQMVTK